MRSCKANIPSILRYLPLTLCLAALYTPGVAGASNKAAVETSTAALQPTGSLPAVAAFQAGNGSQWTIEYVGDLEFSGSQTANLQGDKCRTSVLGEKVVWNCGDMMCANDTATCGFSMGPAFYGTDSVIMVNTTGITDVNDNTFVEAWAHDKPLAAGFSGYGMDTSNIAALNDTHGVTFSWEIQRGGPNATYTNQGNAVSSVTLGDAKPIATRVGPLLTGPNAIQLGLVAILRDGDYIYTYSAGGPSKLIVGRVTASDDVYDVSKYQFLESGSNTWSTPSSGIPDATSMTYGMTTANNGGQFGCDVYGSVFHSAYLNKYVILCTAWESFTNMYVADSPEGPWSAEYQLLKGWRPGYGSMAHPSYSNDGQKTFHFSQGPDGPFNMFKVSFNF